MKQDRKATPRKFLQGRIWREAQETGALTVEFYEDAAAALKARAAAGLRLFVYSCQSQEAQKMLLAHTPYGDLTGLFEGFLDTTLGAEDRARLLSRSRRTLGAAPRRDPRPLRQ